MKKIIVFLMAVLGVNCFSIFNAKASNYSFYRGVSIDGIYMTKVNNGIRYFEKARVLMMSGSNKFAYCVEPFATLNEDSIYTESTVADNLTQAQMKRISLIAHFGYQYNNHTDLKWYAITQFMIWKEAAPNNDMYFTDKLDGNRINVYNDEMNEINNLINDYLKVPSIAGKEINLIEDNSITLTDTNGVLQNYVSDNPNASIEGNNIKINNLQEGEYVINLTRGNNYNNDIPVFYNSPNSQNLTIYNNIDNIKTSLKVKVHKSSLNITKVDKDTMSITPSGNASLSGAIYQLYDENMNELAKLTIGDDMKARLNNLNYGKYYLKEIKAGDGYKLDENIYEFSIDNNNLNVDLILANQVIKKKIEIDKSYGNGINSDKEGNIIFDIYDSNNNLYASITTDANGYAYIIVPYGKYTIKQRNSTDGYAKIDDINIDVLDEEPIKYNLYDYKIKVPNTRKDSNYHYYFIILIMGVIYDKKRIYN